MGFVMPEIVIQKVLQKGLKELRANQTAFLDIFDLFVDGDLDSDYGTAYRDLVWQWFETTKIPVIQAWSFNATRVPSISIKLANEQEDEQKAAFSDVLDDIPGEGELKTAVFTVNLDIGIHANKSGDHVLWLYYIVCYLLFKHKREIERYGIQLSTFSASDYQRDNTEGSDQVWTRWIKLKATTQNFLAGASALEIEGIDTDASSGNPEPDDISVSLDVNLDDLDTTINKGIVASQVGDEEGDNDVFLDEEDEP